MSHIFKLSLKPISGYLTELESDTIFGHFCWRMKETHSEETLVRFLDLYRNNKPVFTLSNSLIESPTSRTIGACPLPEGEGRRNDSILFPVPVLPSVFEQHPSRTKAEKITAFEAHKSSKQRKFVLIDELNDRLNGRSVNETSKAVLIDLGEIIYREQRTGVEIDRETFQSKDGKLFSLSPTYVKNANLCILIKVIDEENFNEFKCEKIIKHVFETGYGLKKSSGFGQFEASLLTPLQRRGEHDVLTDYFQEPKDANGFITLSNYLPANDDGITDYYYDYMVKYGKLGEEYSSSGMPFKYPIIFFKEGSCFKTDTIKEYYGRCTAEGEISNKKEVIQMGIAFTLRMNIGHE